jgi:hypothetical protein
MAPSFPGFREGRYGGVTVPPVPGRVGSALQGSAGDVHEGWSCLSGPAVRDLEIVVAQLRQANRWPRVRAIGYRVGVAEELEKAQGLLASGGFRSSRDCRVSPGYRLKGAPALHNFLASIFTAPGVTCAVPKPRVGPDLHARLGAARQAGKHAASAARPSPSVKQPTVRTDRDRARIPSAMRPWTAQRIDSR